MNFHWHKFETQFNTIITQGIIIVHDLVYVKCWEGFYTLWSGFFYAGQIIIFIEDLLILILDIASKK